MAIFLDSPRIQDSYLKVHNTSIPLHRATKFTLYPGGIILESNSVKEGRRVYVQIVHTQERIVKCVKEFLYKTPRIPLELELRTLSASRNWNRGIIEMGFSSEEDCDCFEDYLLPVIFDEETEIERAEDGCFARISFSTHETEYEEHIQDVFTRMQEYFTEGEVERALKRSAGDPIPHEEEEAEIPYEAFAIDPERCRRGFFNEPEPEEFPLSSDAIEIAINGPAKQRESCANLRGIYELLLKLIQSSEFQEQVHLVLKNIAELEQQETCFTKEQLDQLDLYGERVKEMIQDYIQKASPEERENFEKAFNEGVEPFRQFFSEVED